MKLTPAQRVRYQKDLQKALTDANDAIDRAKNISNTLEESFTILGRIYTPTKVQTTGGHFDHETPAPAVEDSWEESSEEDWNSSMCYGG